jgi:hypothetical protein
MALPIITYGSNIWSITKKNDKEIFKVQKLHFYGESQATQEKMRNTKIREELNFLI